MTRSFSVRRSFVRALARALPLTVLGMAWAHALAALVGVVSRVDVAPHAWSITLGGLALGAAASLGWADALDRRLPLGLARPGPMRPWLTRAWVAFALLAIVQIARLSTWMTDPDSNWFLTTQNPFWADHECLPAYLHGAELALRGDPNVYDAHHYPALDPTAAPETELHAMVVEDPYQYPPPFLLAPASVVAVTHHYPAIRATWFAIQLSLLVLVVSWLASWVGGPSGRAAALGLPVFLSAFPTLHALQYGQFHLSAVLLGVAGMILIEEKREAAGGALLAMAVVAKIFPGILVLTLAVRRRVSAVGWVAAFSLALAVAAVGAFGLAPFTAFLEYQLPRLASGKAFAFGDAWPELAPLVVADNQGVFGLVTKLHAMGATALTDEVGTVVNRGYAALVTVSAVVVSLRTVGGDRAALCSTWVGLVGLASLVSTGAFGDYVPLTAVWLGTLLLHRMGELGARLWLAPALLLSYTLLGTTPLGSWFDPAVLIPISALGVVAMLVLFGAPLAERVFAPSRGAAQRASMETA